MKTTSITIWYRRRAYGVRIALETCLVQERGLWGTNRTRNVFGIGEGPLGYKPHSETCSVQEMASGYEPHSKRVRYRRWASGVRTALETCSVQERGLWGTNRTRNVFGTGEGSLGYEPHSKRVRYRRRVSGVRTTLRNVFGTGEGPLGYRTNPKRMQVQGRRNYKINDYNIN